MAHRSSIVPQPRLLLVGPDPAWMQVVEDAATRIGAAVDVQPDVPSAIAWMMPPGRMYSHVMATVPLSSQEVDALAGMLDEVTLAPTPLLLLGCRSCGLNAVRCVSRPDSDALVLALRSAWRLPPDMPALGADDLSACLHGGGMRMRFQPILRSADLVPVALESLARLHHGQRGILHPRDFIKLAVTQGQERVLTAIAAARTLLDLQSVGLAEGLFVTMNVPIVSLLNRAALRRGIELCELAGIGAERIVIEVLESSEAPDLALMHAAMERWHRAGFRLAIDDAGPALPYWQALLDLPFDIVKLDGALPADPRLYDLAERIVAAARSRGMSVVAEGVETEACLARVRGWGVDSVQGFLFSRPLPSMAVPVWLRQWDSSRLCAAAVRAA